MRSQLRKFKEGEVLQNRYTIIQFLDQTELYTEYRARDKRIMRDICLQFFSLDASMSDEEKADFIRELTRAGKLVHPGIRLVYTSEIQDDYAYLALEDIKGASLRSILEQKPVLGVNDACEIIMQLSRALSYAHKNQLIHQYIRPECIYITTDGRVKLSDFGVSRVLNRKAKLEMESISHSLFKYRPYEIIQGQEENEQADIYSLGFVFYEILCGRLPVTGATIPEFVNALQSFSFPSPSRMNPNVSPELELVILNCFTKDADKRFSSFDHLLKMLEPLYHKSDLKILLDSVQNISSHFIPVPKSITDSIVEKNAQKSVSKHVEKKIEKREERVIHRTRPKAAGAGEEEELPEEEESPTVLSRKSMSQTQQMRRSSKKTSLLLSAMVIVLLLAAGVGGWHFYRKQTLHRLIQTAQNFYDQGIFLSDDEQNAYTVALEVLKRDPDNEKMKSLIIQMKQSFLNEARQAVMAKEWEKAHAGLASAGRISVRHDEEKEVARFLETEQEKERLQKERVAKKKQLLDQAKKAVLEMNWEQALKSCQEALELVPGDDEVYMTLADIYLKQNKREEAITVYLELLGIKQNYIPAYHALSRAYELTRDLKKAKETLVKAIEIDPTHEDTHFRLATILQRQGKVDEAIEEYLKELEILDSGNAHFNIGYLYQKKKKFDEAIEHYSRAIALKPDLLQAYFNLATIFYRQRKYDLALTTIDRVLVIDPEYYKAKKLKKRIMKKLK